MNTLKSVSSGSLRSSTRWQVNSSMLGSFPGDRAENECEAGLGLVGKSASWLLILQAGQKVHTAHVYNSSPKSNFFQNWGFS